MDATRRSFADFQPRYAEHGIVGIPLSPIVDVSVKKACIVKPQHLQPGESAKLARRFPNAGIGCWAGKRNRITVLDVDSTKENHLADAMARFGQSPFIVKSPAKGGYHCYYRHNGEPRDTESFKKNEGKPWDLLGSGLIVMAPTWCKATGRSYEIIHGTLDDLDALPVMCDAPKVPSGRRNKELWNHCMRNAPHCDSLDDLLDVARTFYRDNCDHDPPMTDKEIVRTAGYVWKKTEDGLNYIGIGKFSAVIPADQVNDLIKQGKRAQDALLLTTFLKANNGPNATFIIANGLTAIFGWPRRRLSAARKQLLQTGTIRKIAVPFGGPHKFQWSHRVAKNDHLSSKYTTFPSISERE